MIQTFEAKKYGCLRNVKLKLTPLHAFIGPNDSGKSTILAAIRTIAQSAGSKGLSDADKARLFAAPARLRAEGKEGSFAIESDGPNVRRLFEQGSRSWHAEGLFGVLPGDLSASIVAQFRGSITARFDPAALRQSSKLIPEGRQLEFIGERGLGLPGIYQAILGQDIEAFTRIRDSVRRLFPTVKTLRVTPVSESELVLETELGDGVRVRPEHLSDGLLYYLAFAAIPHLSPASVLLVEEPENGLHPARISEVITLLREFVTVSSTQVLMATHSPLVVNELRPEEVTVVTRDPEYGTQVQLIKDTPHFERRSKAAALGELWLSYADGIKEAPLLGPKAAAS